MTPEEAGIFHRQEKPLLMTNQMTMSISRPGSASRNFNTLLVSPQRISGCPVDIKHMRSNRRIALAAAAVMAMESDVAQGPSACSAHPIHLLSLSPIKIPVLSFTTRGSGAGSAWRSLVGPMLPAKIARVTSLATPGVALMARHWKKRAATDKMNLDPVKRSCPGTIMVRTDEMLNDKNEEEAFTISVEEDNAPKHQRPVASAPVPGSPWCVVWTGDDRVFFFNPTMQLSVWEKPMDLKDRGDLNRIIEDPPHKRKKDSKDDSNSTSSDDDDDDDNEHSSKTKRNKVDESVDCAPGAEVQESKKTSGMSHGSHAALPLELRIAHFTDMLLERGVSAFSTWEKELHKVVFDPRYLLLSSEERKQIFDQFVKARIKEEYKEKKSKLQQAKEEFRKLLEESKITTRSTFKEFSEKYGRDQRFKLVQKKKDQELVFNQFIGALKKRDKENRMRLRKMR
ncbi:transcription elongation regulator 1-like protein isoform X2 [Denticeps clupeoides]|nr:transcription elongation regulator 1-like protein isoform X2 [Denticeps clupeoides]